MPTVLILLGMRFSFYSKEHEPAHVHVKKAGAEAVFLLVPEIELVRNRGFKPHEIAMAEEVIKDNYKFILKNWKMFFNDKNEKPTP